VLSIDLGTLLHDPYTKILTVAPSPGPTAMDAAPSNRIVENLHAAARLREDDDKLLEALLRVVRSLTRSTRIALKLKGKIVFLEPPKSPQSKLRATAC
jgi:hypothetical protein